MNNEKEGNRSFLRGKKGKYLVLLQFLIVAAFILLPVWNPSSLDNIAESTRQLRLFVSALCGIIALLFGSFGSYKLRKYLTPLPYPVDHSKLVQTGVYRLVRHPLYSSQLFAGFGWAFYSLSLSHLLLLIGAFFFFSLKANIEETWLRERHPEYREYARRVRKFIPFIY